jgi:hypothetical protein
VALDEPRDDDNRTTVDGFNFVMSRHDAGMIAPGSELRLDYLAGRWGGGFYVSTGYAASCGVP